MPSTTMLARGVAFALACIACGAVAQEAPTPLTAPTEPAAGPPATRLDYTLDLGAEHSSNINLSETNPVSQNLLIPRLAFTFGQAGSTIQARAAGQVEYRDYLEGAFNNEFRGQLSGILNWVVSPQRLSFAVEDYVGLQPVNTLASNTPTNLQQTNVFGAGPTFNFRFGETVRGQAELRYINSTASKTKQFNSQRGLLALRVIKDVSATDQWSGNLEAEHVKFDQNNAGFNNAGPGYDRYDLYGRYLRKLVHLSIDATLGWSDFAFNQGVPDQNGLLARAQFQWQVDARNGFNLGLARQFADASQELMIDPSQIGTATDIIAGNAQITPQVFHETRIDGGYTFQGGRLRLNIAPFYRRLNYENVPGLNETGHGGTASVNYLLSPLWTLAFAAGEETFKYPALDRHDETLSYGPSVSQQMSPHWGWRLNLTRNQRHSNAIGLSYTENLVFFQLSYKR
ncbi:MAG: hypothetical protein M3R20_04075 [Pseudomonadota bacterium]|nr:hypothetical protein [Pseudomonadota bacterium]